MTQEFHLYGVLVPDLLVFVALAFLLSVPLRFLLRRIGFYRLVWHRALFDTALYVVLLGGLWAAAPLVLPRILP